MTRAIRLLLTVGVCAALLPARAGRCTSARPHSVSVKPAPTRLFQTAYRGWPSAFLLTNGKADVILVPAIGRIMAYQFAGRPQTNILWNNAALLGKPLPFAAPYPPRATDWTNYGGDKLWPAPQDDWPRAQHQPAPWPPDPQMDYGPYRVSRLRNGLRLTGPWSQNRQMRAIRDFILAPGGTRLTLRETFQKSASSAPIDTPGTSPHLPLGLWNIAQARPDATVFVPLNPRSRFAEGYTALAGKKGEPNWHAQDGLLAVTTQTAQGDKVGVDTAQGWIGALYGGSLLFSEQFALDPQGVYPDQNTSLQVWSQSGTDSYLEMEALGPMADMGPGQEQTRTLTWDLRRLPRTPRNGGDARHLVKSVLSADALQRTR